MDFLPVVLTTFGMMHQDGLEVIRRLVKHSSNIKSYDTQSLSETTLTDELLSNMLAALVWGNGLLVLQAANSKEKATRA